MLSPAKINAGLTIYHRSAEGRHYLHGLFLPISFGDDISFQRLPQGSGHELVTTNLLTGAGREAFEAVSERGIPDDNLLLRTLERLNAPPLRITLTKRIPTGGGLGGGSSNAGMLLRYLQAELGLTPEAIHAAAGQLGSDIPFFLGSGAAVVTGFGETITPIAVAAGYGVLALPELSIATGPAYAGLKRPLQDTLAPKVWTAMNEEVRAALGDGNWESITGLKNDFEEVVFQTHREPAQIKAAFFEKGAPYASLSGSGSALFALTHKAEAAAELCGSMQRDFPNARFETFAFPALFEN